MATTYMLGKKRPVFDSRTLDISNYMAAKEIPALPPVPSTRYWMNADQVWPMFLNDVEGCCTISALGHQIMTWTKDTTGLIVLADSAIQTAYSAVGGYVPGNPATDNGATMLSALKYFKKTGIGGHKCGPYIGISKQMPMGGPLPELLQAIDLFGGVYFGLALPVSAQAQVGPHAEWQVPVNGPVGQGQPGSWGGHAIVGVDYCEFGVVCPTWNMQMLLSWNFLATYCDEAWVILSPDWMKNDKLAPSGFNYTQLQNDEQLVTLAA
jgi:hypothetical protein